MNAANDNVVSIETYHNGLPGISASGLIQISRSPAHYRYWKDHPTEPTPAMIKGSAIHAAILEPGRFATEYVALDDAAIVAKIGGGNPRNTNAYKAWKADWAEKTVGKTVIAKADYDCAVNIAAKVYTHPRASFLLTEDGQSEVTLQWTDEATGIAIKARPDRVTNIGLADIKTTQDARPDAFSRAIFNLGYYLQAAVYREGMRVVHKHNDYAFYFVAIEPEPPHGIMVYKLDDSSCEVGLMEFRRCLELYAACTANDTWPGYSTDLMPIGIPLWGVERLVG